MALFQKAVKTQRKLRLAVYGASGSGKTYTALSIASGFGGSIAFIDTENSADLYADKFDFDIAPLRNPTIDNVVEYMEASHDYKTLIIDSFSHPWRELLDEVSKIAAAKYRGNTHSAWSDGNPKQQKLIDAILNYPGHLIVCMRSKTEWTLEEYTSGGSKKVKPVRVGLAPVQGKDIEYEFDMLIQMSPEHYATFDKDRTGKFQDKVIDKPGVEFGRQLIEWLQSAPEKKAPNTPSATANGTPPKTTEPSPNGGSVDKDFIDDVAELFLDSNEAVDILNAEKRTKAQYATIVHQFGRWIVNDDLDRLGKYYENITGRSAGDRITFEKLPAAQIKAAFEQSVNFIKMHINKLKREANAGAA